MRKKPHASPLPDREPPDPEEAQRIREAIAAARREQAATAIRRLMLHRSQGELERLLGLSEGYLSRLAARGDRPRRHNPSPPLVALLTLLAKDPSRLGEVEQCTSRRRTNLDTGDRGAAWPQMCRKPSASRILPR